MTRREKTYRTGMYSRQSRRFASTAEGITAFAAEMAKTQEPDHLLDAAEDWAFTALEGIVDRPGTLDRAAGRLYTELDSRALKSLFSDDKIEGLVREAEELRGRPGARDARRSLAVALARQDALRLLLDIKGCRQAMAAGDIETATARALRVGRRMERLGVREHEPGVVAARGSRRGASKGGKRGRDTRRDKTARKDRDLLRDVRNYRQMHPAHGRPAIATWLLSDHGRPVDFADPTDRKRAIRALAKRIERVEKKSLDT